MSSSDPTRPAATRTDHTLPTTVHGHYWLRPAPRAAHPEPTSLLIGFHGYGETAEDHLAALETLPGADAWHLAAVQALHPFYTRSGKVVASWMTRFDRELAIADNTTYAEAATAAVRRQLDAPETPVGPLLFAGFSQGVAMAYRAAAAVACDGLIALAGDVPPDVDPADLPRVLIGRGTRDDWYDDAKMQADLDRLLAAGAEVETHVFEGGHTWAREFRQAAADFITRTRQPA